MEIVLALEKFFRCCNVLTLEEISITNLYSFKILISSTLITFTLYTTDRYSYFLHTKIVRYSYASDLPDKNAEHKRMKKKHPRFKIFPLLRYALETISNISSMYLCSESAYVQLPYPHFWNQFVQLAFVKPTFVTCIIIKARWTKKTKTQVAYNRRQMQ